MGCIEMGFVWYGIGCIEIVIVVIMIISNIIYISNRKPCITLAVNTLYKRVHRGRTLVNGGTTGRGGRANK